MKTLLLLLLPFVGMGQTNRKETYLSFSTLNELFLRYKKECYADSALHFPSGDDIFYISVDNQMTLSERMKPFWVHRKPTFEGFMEYVEKISQ